MDYISGWKKMLQLNWPADSFGAHKSCMIGRLFTQPRWVNINFKMYGSDCRIISEIDRDPI